MTRRLTLLAGAAALVALLAGSASAETTAITGARIETAGPAGAIPNGTVVITDGRITAVGAGVRVPAGARVIDGAGKVVTPGLIAASTNLTASEVEGVRETHDDLAGAGLSAGFDISYGVNLQSSFVPRARETGVTRAVVTPAPSAAAAGTTRARTGKRRWTPASSPRAAARRATATPASSAARPRACDWARATPTRCSSRAWR